MSVTTSSIMIKIPKNLRLETLMLIVSAYILLMFNRHMLTVISTGISSSTFVDKLFIGSVFLSVGMLLYVYLLLLCHGKLGKWLLALIISFAAGLSYMRDQFNIVYDESMIRNVIETDIAEASELVSVKMILFTIVFGLIPAWFIIKAQIKKGTLLSTISKRIGIIAIVLIALVINIAPFYKNYASLLRNNRELKNYIVPTAFIYSGYQYLKSLQPTKEHIITSIGEDAKAKRDTHNKKAMALVIVLGETARAANFSLSGYEKNTNPLISERISSKKDLIYFTDFSSCGTSTAVSVPCMFSKMVRNNYDATDAKYQEGLLDVFKHAGLDVIWIDNNSGCKNACNRVTYIDTRGRKNEPDCEKNECFDSVLVKDLDAALTQAKRDIVIVMHQKGSHGPAYYKRVPKNMEKFTPICDKNELPACSNKAIVNAYDNTILYTDFILNSTINTLEKHQDQFDSAMFYVSDHGESLGEHNLYLHGLPYSIAPEFQTHVPAVLWLSNNYQQRTGLTINCLAQTKDKPLSHDYFFHSMLSLMQIQTSEYQSDLDFTKTCQK